MWLSQNVLEENPNMVWCRGLFCLFFFPEKRLLVGLMQAQGLGLLRRVVAVLRSELWGLAPVAPATLGTIAC